MWPAAGPKTLRSRARKILKVSNFFSYETQHALNITMSKREKILFIKYIHDCIKDYESNLSTSNHHFKNFRTYIDSTIQSFNERAENINQMFGNDRTIERLLEVEQMHFNLYDTQNQKDKEFILELIANIDLTNSLDTIKRQIIDALAQKKSKNAHSYQLSEVLYSCLTL